MPDNFVNNLQGANVGNMANTVKDTAQQRANQYIHLSEPKKTLADAATEIQQLLKQLEHTNPTATEVEKVAYINDETTPSFKRRVHGALQASGEAAIDEFISENKYLKVVKAAVKGWFQPNG
jgi:Tfp pilus assembly protein PilO